MGLLHNVISICLLQFIKCNHFSVKVIDGGMSFCRTKHKLVGEVVPLKFWRKSGSLTKELKQLLSVADLLFEARNCLFALNLVLIYLAHYLKGKIYFS